MSMSDPRNNLGSIWYHLNPLEVPYSPNQSLDRDFFDTSYSKKAIIRFVYLPISIIYSL